MLSQEEFRYLLDYYEKSRLEQEDLEERIKQMRLELEENFPEDQKSLKVDSGKVQWITFKETYKYSDSCKESIRQLQQIDIDVGLAKINKPQYRVLGFYKNKKASD